MKKQSNEKDVGVVTKTLLEGTNKKNLQVNKELFDLFEQVKSQPVVEYKNQYPVEPVYKPRIEEDEESEVRNEEDSDDDTLKNNKRKRKETKEVIVNEDSEEEDEDEDIQVDEESEENEEESDEEAESGEEAEAALPKKKKDQKNSKVEEKESDKEEESDEDDDQDEEEEEDEERNERTIFVGNLPVKLGMKSLKKEVTRIFKKYGTIESMRFRSAGYSNPKLSKKANAIHQNFHNERDTINAYVVFEKQDSIKDALKENNSLMEGKHLRVDRCNNNLYDHKKTIFVGNMPFNATEEELREHFSSCGGIESVRIVRDQENSIGKGFGFIMFKDEGSVGLAVRLNGAKFKNRPLRVTSSFRKPKKVTRSKLIADSLPAARRISSKKDYKRKQIFEGKQAEQGKISQSLDPKTQKLKQKKDRERKKGGPQNQRKPNSSFNKKDSPASKKQKTTFSKGNYKK